MGPIGPIPLLTTVPDLEHSSADSEPAESKYLKQFRPSIQNKQDPHSASTANRTVQPSIITLLHSGHNHCLFN